jgi:DNA modification methylase
VDSLKPKDLIGIPWRVAFALQADGWYLRQDIIWHKPNPMPESVRDRCTKAHEYIFLLAKSGRYYYDADAIAEPFVRRAVFNENSRGLSTQTGCGGNRNDAGRETVTINRTGRNKRSVWTVTPKPFKGAHFATFPPDLIEPCVLAGAPEGGLVLDPFTGSGTTGMVAVRNGRNFVGSELNPEYADMARGRIAGAVPITA